MATVKSVVLVNQDNDRNVNPLVFPSTLTSYHVIVVAVFLPYFPHRQLGVHPAGPGIPGQLSTTGDRSIYLFWPQVFNFCKILLHVLTTVDICEDDNIYIAFSITTVIIESSNRKKKSSTKMTKYKSC